MANPYSGLFGDISGGSSSASGNPYSGMWDLDDPLALLEEKERARRLKRQEIAATWGAAAKGQNEGLGRVPVPDTSLPGVVAAGVDLAVATAGNAMVGSANLPHLALQSGEEMIRRAGAPFRQAARTKADNEAADRLAVAQRLLAAGGRPRSPLAGQLLANTASPASAVPDPLGGVQEMTQGMQARATQRFAEASTDLSPGLAAAGFWGATTAGLAADASQYLAPGLGDGSRPLSEAAQEALVRRGPVSGAPTAAMGREALRAELLAVPITRREVQAAALRGVEPVNGDIALGAWLDRAGVHPDDLTSRLEQQYFDLHNPDVPMTRPTAPSPELAGRFPGAQIDARDVFEGAIPDGPPRGSLAAQRPGEAGFVRNPWAPESDAYRQSYQLRHDFVTDQNAAVYQSASRSRALQAAIPDRAAREDMTAVFHGTGNPLVKGDTADAAAQRLASSPYAKDANDAIAAWRQRSDELWQMAHDAGAEDLGYWKDYLHMVYEPPKGEKAIVGSEFGQGATTSVMQERSFATPAEAMAAGYTPRSLDFSVLMHETERAHAYTRAVLNLVDDIGGVNEQMAAFARRVGPVRPEDMPAPLILRAEHNPNPSIYERVSGYPLLDRAAPGRPEPEAVQMAKKLGAEAEATNRAVLAQRSQPMLPGLEGLGPQEVPVPGVPETPPNIYVHRDLWRNLKPVLEHDNPAALDRALSVVKRINFFGSLFHGMSLSEAAIGSMGPLRGTAEAAKRGFGIPGLSQLAARLGGGKISEDAALEAIRAGVNVEPPRLDVMQGTFDQMLRQGEEGLMKPGASPLAPRNALAKVLGATRKTAAFYDEALWANYHAPLKVTAYHVNLEKTLAKAETQRLLSSGAMSMDEVRQSVARQVNNQFGGQNWQLLQSDIFSNPKATRWMRRVFLSPDWNYSAISTGLSPFSADPIARQMGRRYWKNAAGLLAGWQLLNYSLSGHFMWNNEPGHAWDLETGLKDDKGRKIFYQVGKHAMETPEFLFGRKEATRRQLPAAEFLLRKTNPVLGGVVTSATGYSPTGIPGALARAREEADKEGRPLSMLENVGARTRDLLGGAAPFVSQEPGAMVRRLLVPFAEKKGLSLHDGQILMAEAVRRGDVNRLGMVREWLLDNGYEPKQIQRAMSLARRQARKFPDGGGDEEESPDEVAPGSETENNPYAQFYRRNR